MEAPHHAGNGREHIAASPEDAANDRTLEGRSWSMQARGVDGLDQAIDPRDARHRREAACDRACLNAERSVSRQDLYRRHCDGLWSGLGCCSRSFRGRFASQGR